MLIWHLTVRMFNVPVFVLPSPIDFMLDIYHERVRLLQHGLITTKLVVIGFIAGAVPGLVLAYMIAKSRLAEQILYPVVVFIQGLPKITLAPLFLVWFGFTDTPKIILTALITFFPVLVDAATGFKSIDYRQYYLSRSVGATWWQTFRFFELPTAAPGIFTGFRTTIVLAVTVVIVVEWLNSQNGLGYLVLRAMDGNDTPFLFAILVVGSLIGVFLSVVIALLERIFVPWSYV